MKTLRISDYNHKRIMDEKNSDRKSADDVISGMFTDIIGMKNEIIDHIDDGNIIVCEDVKKIIGENRYNGSWRNE